MCLKEIVTAVNLEMKSIKVVYLINLKGFVSLGKLLHYVLNSIKNSRILIRNTAR